MIAAIGFGWFPSMEECANQFVSLSKKYEPIQENVDKYKKKFSLRQELLITDYLIWDRGTGSLSLCPIKPSLATSLIQKMLTI